MELQVECPTKSCAKTLTVSHIAQHIENCVKTCKTCSKPLNEGHDCVVELQGSLDCASWQGLVTKYFSAKLAKDFVNMVTSENIPLPMLQRCDQPQFTASDVLRVNKTQMIQYDQESKKLYIGDQLQMVKQGFGLSLIAEGENLGHSYCGGFEAGLYHGEGCYRWPNKDFYQGGFKGGQKDRFGTWRQLDKIYAGFFVENKRHGYGMNVSNQNLQEDIYVGQFEEDVSSGVGIYDTRAGNEKECYAGQWKNGMFDGSGIYVYSDQSVYLGSYLRDQKHGPGFLK